MNLPNAFETKMKELLEGEFDDYITCFEEKRLYGLRVNTGKISVKEFLEISPFPLTQIPWIENGFYYEGDSVKPSKHPYYFAGLYYLQEPSAMTPADRLPIEPGERVLDLCAAPGGKATEMGARLKGQGLIVANDISNSRAKGLLKNMELFGIANLLVLSEDPEKLISYFPEYFDKILIDAPCSGEGMFRKDQKMMKSWEERGPEFFSEIQRKIVLQAAQMLKPGGIMLYSTCTFDPLENESTISYLLEQCPEFRVLEIKPYQGFCPGKPEKTVCPNNELKKTVRIWPHRMQGEGHYMALLQKGEIPNVSSVQTPMRKKQFSGKVPEALLQFFKDVTWEMDWSRLHMQGEQVYYMPEGVEALKGIRFLRTGLYLGDLKKQRFEPSQALAMHLKAEEYRYVISFSVSDER
ncbi:MAG: RsmF rRNA methyltransferase first C-terminal domain-containing protein, partial [Lachnospiraceae bacterium]